MENSKILKKLVFAGAGLILLIATIFGGLHILESTVFLNDEEQPSEISSSKTVEKDEIKYFPRQDITTLLLIGVDEDGPVEEKDPNESSAYADAAALLVFDEKNKTINAIALNRDSMVEMTMLDENGRRKGTFFGQLAFSHSFGNGLEESCENTLWTVSDLLYGTEIDYYISMNMGAITIANDFVGGVTVNVKDDFSEAGYDIPKGEYTLLGEDAETFVRLRRGIGDSLNTSRMERQREYAFGFADAIEAKTDENSLFIVDLYQEISDYIVTDCSVEILSSLAEKFENYEFMDVVSPKGEYVLGEKFMEFYIDEEDLDRIIMEYLYAPK
ncbi:MAG: LCP family protein [Oscillospiraceae bacterium]|nr:LCP family protein [Oscillospiraceae bacterium]